MRPQSTQIAVKGNPAETLQDDTKRRLQEFIEEGNKITEIFGLDIRLGQFIADLKDYVPSEQYNKLINDKEHGFEHGLWVVNLALYLGKKERRSKSINYTVLALGALLHDIYAVISREDHEKKGTVQAKKILKKPDFDDSLIEAVCRVIERHRDENFPASTPLEVKIVRDADTIHETLDLERPRSTSMVTFHRPFFNSELTIQRRLFVLATNEREEVQRKDNDCLQFLLRNITKGLDAKYYFSKSAKAYIAEKKEDLLRRNISEILDYAKKYDDEHIEYIKVVLDDVLKRYWNSSKGIDEYTKDNSNPLPPVPKSGFHPIVLNATRAAA